MLMLVTYTKVMASFNSQDDSGLWRK